ncbi:hypothetical protein [Nonomuraea rubra]|uniref:hypothetical protein n=1 Tax=Nonomuraea rubra TaxID=46180 RepID=UPI0033ED508D
MTRKRRVPIAMWRRLVNHLSAAAKRAGDESGYPLARYQFDRDEAYEALDAALQQQLDDIEHDLTRRDPAGMLSLLGELQRRTDPYRRPNASDVGGAAGLAAHTRGNARRAAELAGRLRRLALTVEVVGFGLGLRAEDYDAEQALDDRLDRMRERAD